MTHVESRLQQRQLNYTPQQLQTIAAKYNEDTAVVIGRRESDEGIQFGYVLIVLIVRMSRPVTVMTRRQSQNFNTKNFNVKKIVYL